MVLEVTGMGQVRFGPGFSFLLPREIDRSHRRRGGNVGIRRGLPDFQARWGRGGNSRFEFSPLSTAPHFHSPGSEAPNHRWASFLSAGTRCPRRNFIDELELRNTRPLDPDLLALFLDAKYVEVREGDRLRPGAIYLVIGLGRDGKKRVLASLFRFGRENLEEWKNILRALIERGLRRLLLVVHDDFSGLLPITRSLFPQADVQLCIVHLQRNAKSHFTKTDAAEFNQRIRALKSAWNAEVAATPFEDLCQHFEPRSPSFIREIRKKRDHYLAFLNYPDSIRRSLSTTNVVEAVNGQLEIMRRNSGGYFHSQDTLKLKLGLAVSELETGRWRRVAASVQTALDQFNAIFQSRFESEE